MYGFLSMLNNNVWPNWASFQDISFEISVTLTLTFHGYSRSNNYDRDIGLHI